MGPTQIIGQSSAVAEMRATIMALARRDCTVLITGESGTGKELAAKMIHEQSARSSGPFVPVDCTTLRDTLFESQLFGHVRGAFTGADRATLGFFRAADAGTLFLDEIGELPQHIQSKLLRCIQEGVVVPLGAVEPVRVNVRIVAATHRDLRGMVREERFREDLYYRLNVAGLHVPPLRARKEDVAILTGHFLQELADLYHEPARTIAPAALEALRAHDWPGNVRELCNALEHALVFAGDPILPEDLPENIRREADLIGIAGEELVTLESAIRRLVALSLRTFEGNQSRAARALGIERHRLRRMIIRLGLERLIDPRERR